jgi:hypothetical protein
LLYSPSGDHFEGNLVRLQAVRPLIFTSRSELNCEVVPIREVRAAPRPHAVDYRGQGRKSKSNK